MSKESIFYNDKSSDVYVENQDDVWDGAYTEVAYEENVEDNSQLNLSYPVEQCSEMSDVYESAVEDNTQYFSIIDNTVNSNLLSDDDTINNSHLNIDSTNTTLVSQFKNEPNEVGTNEESEQKSSQPEEKEIEGEDQVILYRKEGSDELYAVQIARDSDGNVQKYQYQVRQSEDGQLEAVPGTIRIQPEGTEQLICDDLEPQNSLSLETKEEEDNKPIKLESPKNEILYQPKNSPSALHSLQTSPVKPQIEEEPYYNSQNTQIIDDEEFTNVEYLQEDLEEVAATVNLLAKKTSTPPLIIQPKSSIQDQNKRPKIKANIVSIRHENNQPKSLLKRNENQSNFIFDNENIKFKHIPNAASNKTNKLTYLIMTQPVKKVIQKPVQNFAITKKFRSILRPSVGAVKTNSPVIKSFCKAITEKSPTKSPIKTPELIENKKPTPVPEIRGQRQPRKQIITPVDREGSEIIIHNPNENDIVETFDLDSMSDTEDQQTSKVAKTRRRTPKKKGRKPKPITPNKVEIKIEASSNDTLSNSQSVQSVATPVPEPSPKRGPGRRRIEKIAVKVEKNDEKAFESTSENIEVKESNDDKNVVAKRRGRKSRVLNDSNLSESSENLMNTKSQDTKDEESLGLKRKSFDNEIEVPRKRGRPRRKPIVENTNEPENNTAKLLDSEIENMFGFASEDDVESSRQDEAKKDEGDESAAKSSDKSKEDVLLLAIKGAEIIEDFENSDPSTKDATTDDTKKVQVENKKSLRSRRTIYHSVSDTDQKEGIYKCSKCSESFSQYLTYKSHLKMHVTFKAVGGNSCPVCKRSFTSQKLLNQHKLSHLNSITVRLDRLTENSIEMNEELRSLRQSTQMKTEFSEIIRNAEKESKRKNIEDEGKEEASHVCQVCSKEFRHMSHLVIHCENHNQKSIPPKPLIDENLKRNCQQESKVFPTKKFRSSLGIPIKSNVLLTKKTFTCDTCNKNFSNNFFYKNHLKSHQINEKQKETASSSEAPGEKVTLKDSTVQNGVKKFKTNIRHSIRKQMPSAKANAFQCGNYIEKLNARSRNCETPLNIGRT